MRVCFTDIFNCLQENCQSSFQFHSRNSTLATATVATPTSSPVEFRLNGVPLPTSKSSRWPHVVSTVRFVCPVLHSTSNAHYQLLCVVAQRRKKRRRPSRRSSRAAEYIFKGAYAYSTELCMSSATSSAEPSTLAWYVASSLRTGHTHEPQSSNDGRPGVGRAVC